MIDSLTLDWKRALVAETWALRSAAMMSCQAGGTRARVSG